MSVTVTGFWDRFSAGSIGHSPVSSARDRIDFVDYGKGICIILVVMMHSTLGVGSAMGGEGWMHYLVHFSKPFRMPDFFLIAGLFLARTIDTPWRRYIDRKILHFAYFYILWSAILLTFKISALPEPNLYGLAKAYAWSMIEPGSPLWFIYLLALFFLVTRLLKSVPWPIVMAAGVAMEAIDPVSYGTIVAEFTHRFVYFYAGYRFAPQVFAFARQVATAPRLTIVGLALWAIVNGLAVFAFAVGGAPLAQAPGVSFVLGSAGAMAVVAISVLLARSGMMRFLGWLGPRSIVIYLSFVLFMAPARIVLIKFGFIGDIGTVSLLVMMASLAGPLVLSALVASTPLRYLFQRPQWAKLKDLA